MSEMKSRTLILRLGTCPSEGTRREDSQAARDKLVACLCNLIPTCSVMSFAKVFSPTLREIRILCSQTGPASAGTRSVTFQTTFDSRGLTPYILFRRFILSKYPIIKQYNPDLPVLIREASETPARVFARFGACYISL